MPATAQTRRGPGRPAGPAARRPERLEAILDGACRAIVARGFPATRITDVARAAGVSTGTVHYYFETRDDVLLAALKWASERLFARVEAGGGGPRERLAHLLDVSVPAPGPARDEYVLWIELWLRVLHQPELLPECEALSARWRGYFAALVEEGARAGAFTPVAAPAEVADRLVAMVDGLGFETALGYTLDLAGAHARAAGALRAGAAGRRNRLAPIPLRVRFANIAAALTYERALGRPRGRRVARRARRDRRLRGARRACAVDLGRAARRAAADRRAAHGAVRRLRRRRLRPRERPAGAAAPLHRPGRARTR